MGGCVAKDRLENGNINFSSKEMENVKKIFSDISNYKAKTASRKTIGKKGLQHEFQENPDLAAKIYKWMKQSTDDEIITFETYLRNVETLTREPILQKDASPHYYHYELIEMTVLISIEKNVAEKTELDDINLTYIQGLRVIKEILNIFRQSKHSGNQANDLAAKLVTNGIFAGNDTTTIDFKTFISLIKKQFGNINRILKLYYNSKFADRELRKDLRTPYLDATSYVLNDDLIGLFCLSNEQFLNTNKLSLLYCMSKNGSSLEKIIFALKGYEGPTLILLKHVEKHGEGKGEYDGSSVHIFGGFSNSWWEEGQNYCGDSDSFLFSLVPRFKIHHTIEGGDQNFMYLNGHRTLESRVGLGFGGKNNEGFRLWIDENLENGSYASPADGTYEKGYLVEPSIKNFNIEQIEIWGLGGDDAVWRQKEYRHNKKDLPPVIYDAVGNPIPFDRDDVGQNTAPQLSADN